MTVAADLVALGADHHWDFDGDSLDQIGSVNGSDTSVVYTSGAIALDATNCMETNALTDRVTLASNTEINNSAQARKAVCGWFMTTAFQAPPSRIYGEGNETTCFQLCMGFGNNVVFECTEPTNFATGLQVFGLAAVPDRAYHYTMIFSGSAHDDKVKFFVDGVEMTLADPSNRAIGTASLNSRGVAEFGDPAGTTGLGGGVVLQQAPRNGKYQHWATWGDGADALLTDSEVRVTLFEKSALAASTVSAAVLATMQTSLDALTVAQGNEACCVDIEAVTGGGDFTLTSDLTFDELASIHFRYTGTADTLTIINVSGGDASIGSAPFGGSIILATRQTLTVTVLDSNTQAAVVGARVYIEADTGGDLASGTVIMSAVTNGSGVATATHDYTSDQPIIGRIRKGSASPFYKTNSIAGPLGAIALDTTVLMLPDE
jgi:hypothetical protein